MNFGGMNFGVLVFPQAKELDFVGPWEMVTMWQQVAEGPKNCLIVAQSLEPVRCAKGLRVLPDVSFDTCPPLDYLLVPGGQGTRTEIHNPALLGFVAQQAKGCQAVLSVCTGSLVLHAAGLLLGKTATTHWGALNRLRACEGVTVREDRYTRDGHIWCSAGVSAGIDMTLRFIAETAGEDAAGKVQFASEYYPDKRVYGDYKRHPQAPGYLSGA